MRSSIAVLFLFLRSTVACFDQIDCSFDNGNMCFNFGGSAPFTGRTFVSSPTGGIPSQSGNGFVLLDTANGYFDATCPQTTGTSYCELQPNTANRGPFARIGGGNFGDGPSPPSTRKFEDFTVSTWIYFDVNAAMQSAAEAVDATRYNRRGGLRLSMTNAVYGARDYIFNFGFMNNIVSSGTVTPTPGSNPDQCLYVVMTNNAAQEAYEGRGFKVACVSSSPTNPSNPADRWYQLETQFSAVTVGSNPSQLSALMTVRRSDGTLIASETRTNAADVISNVGGNNYMWFPYNNFPANSVGFDSVELIPEEPCLVITE